MSSPLYPPFVDLTRSQQVNPACRLVGQKMNPSRTYTPSGAVGIAGVVAAIYPVESPGGYQLFGRTLPTWQAWGKGSDFAPDRPWLLQAFDHVVFEPVSEEAYLRFLGEFESGRYKFKVSERRKQYLEEELNYPNRLNRLNSRCASIWSLWLLFKRK